MPDITFPKVDDLPEELRSFAKPIEGGNGAVVINLVPNDKLREFRENNINISKERDDLKKLVDEIKTIFPEFDAAAVTTEINELRNIQKRVKDGSLTENKAIEEALAERTKEMKTALETQLQAARTAQQQAERNNQALAQRLKQTIIRQAITSEALNPDSGVQPSAVDDIVSRALTVYDIDDDEKLVAKQGGTILYGSDGTTPMTPKEWLTGLKDKSPHLFKQSTGGGGGAERRFGGFSQQDIDKMTPEQKIALANEQAAARR